MINRSPITELSGPLYVLWEVTNQCGLDCLYCATKGGTGTELTDKEAEAVVEELVSLKPVHVFFSGGEPLVREALLRRLVSRLTNAGIRCGLMTDGTMVNSSNAEWLKSSLFQVRVGFDGANPEIHDRMRGRTGAFNSAIRALKLLQGGSAELAIAMALHKETANQIIPIAELATANGVSALFLQWLTDVGRAIHHPDLFLQESERLRVIEQGITELSQRYEGRLKTEVTAVLSFPSHLVNLGSPNPILNIRPDGAMAPYRWIPVEVGNVREGIRQVWKDRLANIWNEPRVSEAVRSATSIQAFTTMLNVAAAVLVEDTQDFSAISPAAVPVWKAPPFSREESEETRLVLVQGSPFICNTSTWEILRHIDGKTPVGTLLKRAQTVYPAVTITDVQSVLTSLAGVIALQESEATEDNRR